VTEWIDGKKLSDSPPPVIKELIVDAQEAFLVQLLQVGFFHRLILILVLLLILTLILIILSVIPTQETLWLWILLKKMLRWL